MTKGAEKKKGVGVNMGPLVESVEDQLNDFGYTLGDLAPEYDMYKKALSSMGLVGLITDREMSIVVNRFTKLIHKKIIKIGDSSGEKE